MAESAGVQGTSSSDAHFGGKRIGFEPESGRHEPPPGESSGGELVECQRCGAAVSLERGDASACRSCGEGPLCRACLSRHISARHRLDAAEGGRSRSRVPPMTIGAAALIAALLVFAGFLLRGSRTGALTVEWDAAPAPVAAGGEALAAVRTLPGAVCTASLWLHSGPSQAAGLGVRTPDESGYAVWRWTVAPQTAPGRWPLTVACSSGGEQAQAETLLEVRAR